MVNNALKDMDREQLENYRKIGEVMYGNVDFVGSKINSGPDFSEAVAYVESGIRAGLLPEDLDENEVNCLFNAYGETWYERFGWTKDESPQPGLSLAIQREIDEAIDIKLKDAMSKDEYLKTNASNLSQKAISRKDARLTAKSNGKRVNNKHVK
jgi:hypothetical protein